MGTHNSKPQSLARRNSVGSVVACQSGCCAVAPLAGSHPIDQTSPALLQLKAASASVRVNGSATCQIMSSALAAAQCSTAPFLMSLSTSLSMSLSTSRASNRRPALHQSGISASVAHPDLRDLPVSSWVEWIVHRSDDVLCCNERVTLPCGVEGCPYIRVENPEENAGLVCFCLPELPSTVYQLYRYAELNRYIYRYTYHSLLADGPGRRWNINGMHTEEGTRR